MWYVPLVKFAFGNWKKLLIGVAASIVFAYSFGFVKEWKFGKETTEILQCNEQLLKDQITTLQAQLEQAEKDNILIAEELNEIKSESVERASYAKHLEDLLKNTTLDDGDLSPRTRQFYQELNNRAKEMHNETPTS